MIFQFAWRYFRAKKSANAINIIAWVTTGVIAFATCCQILVLSVFNGFEGLVKSLYSSFYADIKIVPGQGKTFLLDSAAFQKIKNQPKLVAAASLVAEERTLLQNEELRTAAILKGVDDNYSKVTGLAQNLVSGKFFLGTVDKPGLVVGYGVQGSAGINVDSAYPQSVVTVISPRKNVTGSDPLSFISEGNAGATGVFAIQQEFDNNYALTNIDFVRQQLNFASNEYSAVEIKLQPGIDGEAAKKALQPLLPPNTKIQSRYEQNTSLYNTMRLEKWAIFAILTLVLIIAAFNMISAVTMLVLEKKKDVGVLRSLGGSNQLIQKIFLAEGILLGVIGCGLGIFLATVICLLQLKFKIIKLNGGSFLIDYFPVKLVAADFLLVAGAALFIAFFASWFPSVKAARQPMELK